VSIAPLQFTHAIDLPRSLKALIRMGSFDSPEDHPCKTKLQSRSLQSPGRYKPNRCCDNENAGNEQSAVSKIESGAIGKNDKKYLRVTAGQISIARPRAFSWINVILTSNEISFIVAAELRILPES